MNGTTNKTNIDTGGISNTSSKKVTIYCHFSFKRPRGETYGIFAVAFYSDFAGKDLITYKVRQIELWKDHQFVTAIQSYYNALLTIHEFQGQMREAHINHVMLVTDNSTLAGWIEYPKKNKDYAPWMEKAVKPFRAGSFKEIIIGVGLCEPRKAEKSYKYCKHEFVTTKYTPAENGGSKDGGKAGYKIDIGDSGYRNILDILAEDKATPEIIGIKPIK